MDSFSPEVVLVLPGTLETPPYPLDIPTLTLAEAAENGLLNDQGRSRRPESRRQLLGRSETMVRFRKFLQTMANTQHPLLLTGENGTGKDLAAHIAHEFSARRTKNFYPVDCGAIPSTLAETEFFGCVKGAFTGAENRVGFCQQAQGGTLFLDEIGELSLEIQSKLLRALDNREIRRVGSDRIESVDFRLICATNRDLAADVAAGRFREDLYYRINVLSLKLPALRERKEDLPLLAAHFLQNEYTNTGKPYELGTAALAKMADYHWPGNLRQLRNVLLKACVLHPGPLLEPRHIHWD